MNRADECRNMPTSKSSRSSARSALKRLQGPRATPRDSSLDIFPFGLSAYDRKGDRRPRNYDDRSIAIIVGSVLDQGLESALLTRLRPLNTEEERAVFLSEGAPLSTFSAKITLGYSLGLFGRMARDDLHMIRSIRNTFAHSRLSLDFDHASVAAACMELTLPERVALMPVTESSDPRECFIHTAFQYAVYFITYGARPFDDEDATGFRAKVLDLTPTPGTSQ